MNVGVKLNELRDHPIRVNQITIKNPKLVIEMQGKEVYRQAVLLCVRSITETCERAGVTPADIGLFVAHQANVRIIDAVMERLGMPRERAAIVLDRTGNTSAASVPLALADAADAGRVADGDLVMLCGFGAGMTWATQIWRWGR